MLDVKRKIICSFLHEFAWHELQERSNDYYYFMLNLIMQFIYSSVTVDDVKIDMKWISEKLLTQLIDVLAEEMRTFHREYQRAYQQLKKEGYVNNPDESEYDAILLEISHKLPDYTKC